MIFVYTGFAAGKDVTLNTAEIIAKANHAALYQGMDIKGKVSMAIKDNNGQIRRRQFNLLRKNGDNGEQKYYTLFQRPADVRKMVFMVHKHADLQKDDDRWLYLPGLDLVKRIAASDKRTSFAGSDFLYEDISGRNPAADQHQLLRTTKTQYVIKNTPKEPDRVEFVYYLAYIDKQSFLPMKMEFFKAGDQLYRMIEALKVDSIHAKENGQAVTYPTVTVSLAKDLEKQSQTEMVISHIQYNVGLKDSLFSERFLRRPPKDAIR
jgi:hypothetical protein